MSTNNRFGERMREHLARVEKVNGEVLERIAEHMYNVVETGRLIYVGGTGHSMSLMLETFYRAGGLACVQPIYSPALLPLHGGADSTLAEKTPGFGRILVDRYAPGPGDIAFIFSNSGVNAVPVELADELHRCGTPVVAIVSLAHMRAAPARAPHKIDALADYVVDTLVPYGDAAYPTSFGVSTAGLSSLTGIYLWNLLLTQLADLAAVRGTRLPIFTSANVEGGVERNVELIKEYRDRIPML